MYTSSNSSVALQRYALSKDVTLQRSKARTKKGEAVAEARFLEFQYTSVENGQKKSKRTDRPPAVEVMVSKDDKNKKWNAKLIVWASLQTLNIVPGHVEERTDGQEGWRVLVDDIYYLDDAKKWIADHAQSYLDGTYQESFSIGPYVTPEGNLAESCWINLSPDQLIKFKVPGGKDSIFRKTKATGDGLYIGRSMQLRFPRIKFKQVVSMRAGNMDSELRAAHAEYKALQEKFKDDPEKLAVLSEPPKPPKTPAVYLSLDCGNPSLADSIDPDMIEAERLKLTRNANKHVFVPIEELRDPKSNKRMPRQVDLYIKDGYMTTEEDAPTSDSPCTSCIVRDTGEPGDFLKVYDDEKTPRKMTHIEVGQWLKKDGMENGDTYVVSILSGKPEKELWRTFGIINPDAYAEIMMACYDFPMHMTAEFWYSSTMQADANHPDKLGQLEETKHIKGYYTLNAVNMVPDCVDYFMGNDARAIEVSKAFVLDDFAGDLSENKKTGQQKLHLSCPNKEQNTFNRDGVHGQIISLGCGKEDPKDDDKRPFHAFTGNAWTCMGDDHRYFVLTSLRLNGPKEIMMERAEAQAKDRKPADMKDEVAQYCGVGKDLEQNDAFVKSIIEGKHERCTEDHPIFYHIYAVRKDIKLAKSARTKLIKTTPSKVKPSPASKAKGKKNKRKK